MPTAADPARRPLPRRHARLLVTVGRGANDGEKGEGDKVLKTVEVRFGGAISPSASARATASSPAASCDTAPRRRHGRHAPRAAAPRPAARGAAGRVRAGRSHPAHGRRDRRRRCSTSSRRWLRSTASPATATAGTSPRACRPSRRWRSAACGSRSCTTRARSEAAASACARASRARASSASATRTCPCATTATACCCSIPARRPSAGARRGTPTRS